MTFSETEQAIYQGYLQGVSIPELAKQSKQSCNWVTHFLKVAGIKFPPPKRLTQEEKEFIINEYLSGKSSTNISKEQKLSTETVCEILRKQGIMKKKGDVSFRKHSFDYDFFKKVDTEEKAYWLGFIYADGNIKSDNYTFVLTIKVDDILHLEELKKVIKYSGEIKIEDNDKYKRCSLVINSQHLCADFLKLGVTPRKTFTIKFPTEEQVPNELMSHFLRGYFDGDGYVEKNGKEIEIIGTTEFLFGFTQKIYENTELSCSYIGDKNKFTNGIQSLMYYGAKRCSKIYDYLYKDATVYLDRKEKRFKHF
jgi:intein-encoded DNA endonuclease-like protein